MLLTVFVFHFLTCNELLAVATPKQIRELMKVDGLTNDEVKSHLQVRTSRSSCQRKISSF